MPEREASHAAGAPADTPVHDPWKERRLALADALTWVRSGPYTLELHDVGAPELRMTVLGPQELMANDIDLLVPDDRGQGGGLLRLGFQPPDDRHQGYWWDNIGSGPGGDDDDQPGDPGSASRVNNQVTHIVEFVYMNLWKRPPGFQLVIRRSVQS